MEGWYWNEIREKVGRVTELMSGKGNTGLCYGGTTGERYRDAYDGPEPRVGWFSDDTTSMRCGQSNRLPRTELGCWGLYSVRDSDG